MGSCIICLKNKNLEYNNHTICHACFERSRRHGIRFVTPKYCTVCKDRLCNTNKSNYCRKCRFNNVDHISPKICAQCGESRKCIYVGQTTCQRCYCRNHNGNRRKTDIRFRLSSNLRSRLKIALKCNYKRGSAVRDLGCSIDFFKQYMESLFTVGMSWDNYGQGLGRWSIDHIIPLSRVDLTDREQLLKVCHYTNLQPLWDMENKSKFNKLEI